MYAKVKMGTNAKRLRSDSETDLNDTLQGAISEFKTIQEPSNKDIGNLLVTCLESLMAMNTKLYDHHQAITELQSTVSTNSVAIKVLNQKNDDLEKKINKIQQFEVDNDIFISGFTTKPDPSKVTAKLLSLMNLPESSILYKYAFSKDEKPQKSSTPQDPAKKNDTKHFMVISFASKNHKINFFRIKKGLGKISYHQLLEVGDKKTTQNSTINFSNRLSIFNMQIFRKLIKLKEDLHIKEFQLHNGFMRFKKSDKGPWSQITTENDISKLPIVSTAEPDLQQQS